MPVTTGFGSGGVSSADQAKLDAITISGTEFQVSSRDLIVNAGAVLNDGSIGRLRIRNGGAGGSFMETQWLTASTGPLMRRAAGADVDALSSSNGIAMAASNSVTVYQPINGSNQAPVNLPIDTLTEYTYSLAVADLQAKGAVSTAQWDTGRTIADGEFCAAFWVTCDETFSAGTSLDASIGRVGNYTELYTASGSTALLTAGGAETSPNKQTAYASKNNVYLSTGVELAIELTIYGTNFAALTTGGLTFHVGIGTVG